MSALFLLPAPDWLRIYHRDSSQTQMLIVGEQLFSLSQHHHNHYNPVTRVSDRIPPLVLIYSLFHDEAMDGDRIAWLTFNV